MTIESLSYINRLLVENGINYELLSWTSEVVYPYFVGEYQESPSLQENGLQETLFILNGFTRGKWLELENAKAKIEKITNITTILPNGNGIAILYEGSSIIPTYDEELKRIQINLNIKEWKV